ncbi:MAG: PAS domain-containing protein, partial [Myxococcales bacterium]|nr:PAS domain-containing protein [Myxococcales bacterium]
MGVYREILDAQREPTVLLDSFGMVVSCNRALLDLLRCHNDQVIGEPLLAWFPRTDETAAFGRAFLGLRARAAGHGFNLTVHLAPAIGGQLPCQLQGRKLSSGHILVSGTPIEDRPPIEADVGGAIKRSLEAL